MRIRTITTLAQRQKEINRAKRREKKSKAPPPQRKALNDLLQSVRTLVSGFADKSDVEIFELAGYGNRGEASAAYDKAVQSENADDGLVRAYLTGLLNREASSLIKTALSTNTSSA